MGETPTSKTCDGMKGLLEEGETMMNETPARALRDAVMITGAQKVEHYEMASYGTVRTYARVLGEAAVARLLQRTLNEEKAANAKLTQIAEGSVNEEAAEEWQAQDDESLLSRTADWAGSAAAVASRSVTTSVRRAAATLGLSGGRPRKSSANRTRAPKRASTRRTSKKR
jgi:hypothetical protein